MGQRRGSSALACPAAGSWFRGGIGGSHRDFGRRNLDRSPEPLPANASAPDSGNLDLVSCSAVDSCAALGFYTVLFGSGPAAKALPEDLVETLGIPLAPVIASANQATFTKDQQGTFTIDATGAPVPAIVEKGELPKGLRFTAGDGHRHHLG